MVAPSTAVTADPELEAQLSALGRAAASLSAAPDTDAPARELLEALPAAVYTTDAEGTITYFNEAAVTFSGRRPTVGVDRWCVTWRLFHPDGAPLPHDRCPMAVALKEGRAVRGVEAIAERPDGTRVHFTPYPTPLRNARGELVGAVNMLVDITQRKEFEAQIRLLSQEVDHRANNVLSIVQAAIRLTEAETVADFKTAIEGRIAALGRAHGLLAKSRWSGVEIGELVEAELAAQGGLNRQRAQTDGEIVLLSAHAAQAFALALHELAANAEKHGALKGPHGSVNVAWRATTSGELSLVWRESGGPTVVEPRRRGVGAMVIERAMRQLGGQAAYEWRPEGLEVRLLAPLRRDA